MIRHIVKCPKCGSQAIGRIYEQLMSHGGNFGFYFARAGFLGYECLDCGDTWGAIDNGGA